MFGLHVDQPVADAGADDDLFHLAGDVYELQTLSGMQSDQTVARPHHRLTDFFNTRHFVHSSSCGKGGARWRLVPQSSSKIDP
jgi:hypothetical protein